MLMDVRKIHIFSFNILEIVGGYRFGGNSYEIFDKFFGTSNPFNDVLEDNGRDQYGSMFGDAFGGQN